MNIWNNHFNEEIFPDATEFKPERWLRSNSRELERYLVPFGAGSRMCIGIKYVQNSALYDCMDPICWQSWAYSLSLAEQYLTFAHIFRSYKLKLFETTKEDVTMRSSYMITLSRPGFPGVRVVVEKLWLQGTSRVEEPEEERSIIPAVSASIFWTMLSSLKCIAKLSQQKVSCASVGFRYLQSLAKGCAPVLTLQKPKWLTRQQHKRKVLNTVDTKFECWIFICSSLRC